MFSNTTTSIRWTGDGEIVQVDAWGEHSVRVRASDDGRPWGAGSGSDSGASAAAVGQTGLHLRGARTRNARVPARR